MPSTDQGYINQMFREGGNINESISGKLNDCRRMLVNTKM